jgi:L-ribulose-5-phosphate 3-epimerase
METLKKLNMKQNRREFISKIAAAGAALPFAPELISKLTPAEQSRFPLRLFSKPLDAYDFGFMCECTAQSGCGGFDLTVRPGGKVEPADVESKLPGMVREAEKYKLKTDMICTGIGTASDPLTERVLKTASSLGVKHYRLGYYDIDNKTGVWEQLQKHKESLKGVVELNRKYKIHGGYQNHAGARVGGPVWDLYELLKDFPPEFAGVQYDIRHAMVEGANAWILGLRLLAPYIKTLAIKDFTWKTVNGRPRAETVPMGEGMINWDLFFRTVKELNISGPMTLHVEYPLFEKGEEKLPLPGQKEIIVRKIKKDVDFLNGVLLKNQII